jgi:hypothetical protein
MRMEGGDGIKLCPIGDDDEMPGLLVAGGRCHHRSLDNGCDKLIRDGSVLKLADASPGFNGFEEFHGDNLSE